MITHDSEEYDNDIDMEYSTKIHATIYNPASSNGWIRTTIGLGKQGKAMKKGRDGSNRIDEAFSDHNCKYDNTKLG